MSSLRKCFSIGQMATSLAAAALFLVAGPALADDCGNIGGSINIGTGECEINSAASASGSGQQGGQHRNPEDLGNPEVPGLARGGPPRITEGI